MLSRYQAAPQATAVGPSAVELNGNIEFRAREGVPGDQNEGYLEETWKNYTIRASASYVTGSHSLKFGIDLNPNSVDLQKHKPADYQVQLLNGVPNTAVFVPLLDHTHIDVRKQSPFVQDQWTVARRLTVNAGLRMDFFQTRYAPSVQPPTSLLPERRFPGANVMSWKDVSPRLGIAFDLFGTGKTALKASLNRYLAAEDSGNTRDLDPGFGSAAVPLRRAWNDANHDFIPDGDPLNPLPNGEFTGPSNNVRFGQPTNTLRFDPEWQSGWGVRGNNWETSVGVQHEVATGTSVTVSYIRRSYGNFIVNDNLLTAPSDYDPYCITTPIDSRLADGGGQQICGLYDIQPSKAGLQGIDRLRTIASNYGDQYERWQGVDLNFNARLPRGTNLQGGMSTGKAVADNCDVVNKLDNPSQYLCHRENPFLNDFKLVGSVILPARIELASTFQSSPHAGISTPQFGLAANYVATSASIAPSLNRSLAAGANSTVTINVNPPGRNFNDRVNQIDMRIARTFGLRRTRLKAILDLYNVTNGSPVLAHNQAYGTTGTNWLVPQAVLVGRIVKFGGQFSF
jgi:hypothetical protein